MTSENAQDGGEHQADRPLRLGSLCMGYGGLDLAIEHVLGASPIWCAEFDDAPAQVIEARWPGLPNYRDITSIDWSSVPPVDVLTAGYPCQPFSHAGRRKGTNDERHLWPYIADALRVLRPRLAVFENVAGHVSLGLDVVLADLASLGFDAEWSVVRADEAAGACHRRERLFIVAADASGERGGWDAGTAPRAQEPAGRRQAHEGDRAVAVREDAADADGMARATGGALAGRSRPLGEPRAFERALRLRGVASADAHNATDDGERARPQLGGRDQAASDAHGEGLEGREPASGRDVSAWGGSWGDYGPAIARHAAALGRPAPAPVDDNGRLSPRFVEWMMMLPEGWVTDVLSTRTKALKALGNGVVPPQAAHAVNGLLGRLERGLVAA